MGAGGRRSGRGGLGAGQIAGRRKPSRGVVCADVSEE